MNITFETMGTIASISIMDPYNDDHLNSAFDEILSRFTEIDKEFSTYRTDNFISLLNTGGWTGGYSEDAVNIFRMAERYNFFTEGYFSITTPEGKTDPSGIVKAYAIRSARRIFSDYGITNWCLNVGGDILIDAGTGLIWPVGITDPQDRNRLVSDVGLNAEFCSVATSGVSERGDHIWNPVKTTISDILQATVISDDIIFSDVMATALVARGSEGQAWFDGRPSVAVLLALTDGSINANPAYMNLIRK